LAITVREYIHEELRLIPNIIRDQANQNIEPLEIEGEVIAVGAGDSYAAALTAQYLSGFKVIAADPLDFLNSVKSSPKTLIAISVKGKTIEVVQAAKKVKELGGRVLALTANEGSPLAQVADKVVKIVYLGGKLPAGIGNFISTITAIATLLDHKIKNEEILQLIKENPPAPNIPEKGDLITVGEGLGLVSALFSCLKINEFLCRRCYVDKLEQFLHAPIFTLSKNDKVYLFLEKSMNKGNILKDILRNLGYNYVIAPVHRDPFVSLIYQITWFLKGLATYCGDNDVKQPCFVTRRELLRYSTPAIYRG